MLIIFIYLLKYGESLRSFTVALLLQELGKHTFNYLLMFVLIHGSHQTCTSYKDTSFRAYLRGLLKISLVMRVCEKLLVEVGPSGHRGPGGSLIARGREVPWHMP